MNQELLKHAPKIFDTLDKWNALFEIHRQTDAIIEAWLTQGAEALQKSYANDPNWGCKEWGSKRDTRWYLKGCEECVGIGLGWPGVELHLYLANQVASYDDAFDLLKTAKFQPLLHTLDLQTPSSRKGDGSLASNTTFNPCTDATDWQERRRELAWQAGRTTDEYVKKMGGKIRLLTDNAALTALFRELNQEICERTNERQLPQ